VAECENDVMPGEATDGSENVDAHRFGVRCSRCGRTQPPDRQPSVSRWPYCVYCAAPLAVQRWVAMPPAGGGPALRVRRPAASYHGPPRYGGRHPGWGFPPIARLRSPDPSPGAVAGHAGFDAALGRRFTVTIGLALAVFVVALAAAGSESWRYALLLRGRTEVLPATLVRASDFAVGATSLAAVLLSAAALLAFAVTMVACYRAAAWRAGVHPARSAGDIAVRFLVPGWNLFGAGQIVVEVMHLVFPVRGVGRVAPRGVRRVVAWCWIAWAGAGALAAALAVLSMLPMWGVTYSNQTAANLVEAHIVVDLVAAAAALLSAVTLALLRAEWTGERPGRARKWVVAQPISTPRNRGSAESHARAGATARERDDAQDRGKALDRGGALGRGDAPDRRPALADSVDLRAHAAQHRR
jgi:hypothetical protein